MITIHVVATRREFDSVANDKRKMIMKTIEIKEEINKIIEKLPEEVLGDLLEYLQQVEKNTAGKFQLTKNLRKILTEDKELLEKLAK
jgi:hypothetical protein